MTNPYQPNPWADPTSQPQAPPTTPGTFAAPDPGYSAYSAGAAPVPPQPLPQPTSYPGYGTGYAAGYGGGYPPAAPVYYPMATPAKTNGLSIGSMVVSIVALPLLACYGVSVLIGGLGAILGHVARRQIRTNREGGEGMALAGIIIGWIGVGLGLIIGGLEWWGIIYAINNSNPSSPYNDSFDNGRGFDVLLGALGF